MCVTHILFRHTLDVDERVVAVRGRPKGVKSRRYIDRVTCVGNNVCWVKTKYRSLTKSSIESRDPIAIFKLF